jgi:hypothetical protein
MKRDEGTKFMKISDEQFYGNFQKKKKLIFDLIY